MRRNNTLTTVLVVNAVVLGAVALNAYRPKLEKIASDYVNTKRKTNKNNSNHKLEQKKALNKAVAEIASKESLAETALKPCDICSVKEAKLINEEIHSYLVKKTESLPLEMANSGALTINLNNTININKQIFEITNVENEAAVIPSDIPEPTIQNKFMRNTIGTLAMIIALNSIGFEKLAETVKDIDINTAAIESTIDDIEEFFIDTFDVAITLNDHNALVERKINRIISEETTDHKKINGIYNLEELSQDEKIATILHLKDVNYTTKFDFFLNSGYFTIEEAMEIIIPSNITLSANVFDYIMNIEAISLDQKVDYIINSDLTIYTRIFDYLLSNKEISKEQGIEYILNSSIANYEEKFAYFMKRDFSTYEKIWISLQIPNVPFDTVLNDLLSVQTISEEDVITSIMQTDLISFKTLFNSIQNIKDINAEKLSNYLIYYNEYCNNGYNKVELNDLIDYAMNIEIFTQENKIECFWNILNNLSLIEKEEFILNYFNTTTKEYVSLYINYEEDITEEQSILLNLFEKINQIKLDYILTHYNVSYAELKQVMAGCAAEGYSDYDDIYWVINTIFNRIIHPWYSKKGISPYVQFISPSQFSVYGNGRYLKFLYPTNKDDEKQYHRAEIAVINMLYLGYDGIEHNYYEFRSWGTTDFSNNYVVEKGNRYNKTLREEDRVIYETLIEDRETENNTVKERKLSQTK